MSVASLACAGDSGDIGKIDKVTINPDPPQKGSDLSVEADVTLSKYIYSIISYS